MFNSSVQCIRSIYSMILSFELDGEFSVGVCPSRFSRDKSFGLFGPFLKND